MNKAYPLQFKRGFESIWQALKGTSRTGWLQWQIPKPESVAEHILATRQLAIELKSELDLSETDFVEVLALIEIHDWSKVLAGDRVVLGDEINVDALRSEKKKAEQLAMERLTQSMPNQSLILKLYTRYEEQADNNAVLAKELGLYQTLLTAKSYEEEYKKVGLLKEFYIYTEPYITLPILRKKLVEIKELI